MPMWNTWPAAVMRSPSWSSFTQPVPSMATWLAGFASTENTASRGESMVVVAVICSLAMRVSTSRRPRTHRRGLAGSVAPMGLPDGASRFHRRLAEELQDDGVALTVDDVATAGL